MGSQAVPMSSSLTWNMEGDESINKIHVSQNAADSNSPLNCSPDCPQDDEGGAQPATRKTNANRNSSRRRPNSSKSKPSKQSKSGSRKKSSSKGRPSRSKSASSRRNSAPSTRGKSSKRTKVSEKEKQKLGKANACPGSSLEKCVEICPGKYGPKIFAACVKTCGKRC